VTREQLDAIRARLDEVPFLPFEATLVYQLCANVRALLAEVEGMRESCTGLVKQNERQYDEVLRLTEESDESKAVWRAYVNRELSEDEAKARLAALEAK
jgi:hypothetical protein